MRKLRNIGFVEIQRGEELRYGIEECAQIPVFTSELLELMRRLIPRERWTHVARSVIFEAWKARAEGERSHPAGPVLSVERHACLDGAVADLPEPHALCDLGAAGCEEGVLLRLRNLMAGLAPGQVLEIRSTDPGVREDLPAWCRLTRHEYLGAVGSRYFVRKR